MAGSPHSGFAHLVKALHYSWAGLREAYRLELPFRMELWTALAAIPAGLWLGSSGVERALLVGTVIIVLAVELLNSAIEAAIDRFGDEYHELSARAKDMGSAAVLVSLVLSTSVWGLVLLT